MTEKIVFRTGQQALDHVEFLTVAAVRLAEKWKKEGRNVSVESGEVDFGLALEEVMRVWDEEAKKLGVKA